MNRYSHGESGMWPAPNHGDWVRWSDVEALRRELELSLDAYRNMKAFAEANGLDTTTTSP